MLKIQDIMFEYDDDGELKDYRISFDMSNNNDDYVNGRVVLDASDLDAQTIVDTVQSKLKALVQS
ncbi:hypothetical protein INP51_13855 [Blautia liquoris]|uniref:Uncharacterized protein n=1 Tax=Blautia liquoris TaxID=2779518 RepID=A0A7M2RFV8_9FIRM|nr:hypothetical protein [Blautia liquoris]QOV19028.1 hypothetical protein INP51_13855 [Blautia liquoris]